MFYQNFWVKINKEQIFRIPANWCKMNKFLREILEYFKNLEQVKAIAIGGSYSSKTFDSISDIDIYIFVNKNIPLKIRKNIIEKYSNNSEIGGEYFGSGDEFYTYQIGMQLDVMYWNVNWFERIVKDVWFKHLPSNGYTTAFLYTLKNFEIIYDTDNWLKNLQDSLDTEYPKELKQNIINRNLMLMKDKPFASYYEQIKKAIKRDDWVSINHRTSAFLASYFDVIFAVNEILHPGEKRLIKYAKNNCKILPEDFEENIDKLLKQDGSKRLKTLNDIVENLRKILV